MSSEVTAEYFKDKSEEEIINWMLANLTPEQIKTCLGSETPDKSTPSPSPIPFIEPSPGPSPSPSPVPVPKPEKVTVDDLRRFCANKRYIIHKIETVKEVETVFFWYFLTKSNSWNYTKAPLETFPKMMGEEADNCGSDDNVTDKIKDNLIDAFSNDKFAKNKTIDGEPQQKIFNDIKEIYSNLNINEDWLSQLIKLINIQRNINIPVELKTIFSFAPILIESIEGKKVNYYYLSIEDGEVSFSDNSVAISGFKNAVEENIEELVEQNMEISSPGEPSGANAKTIEEWKNAIKEVALDIDSEDIKRIQAIYDANPLSENTKYFIDIDIFEDLPQVSFGKMNLDTSDITNFGKLADLKTGEIEKIIRKKYGPAFLKRYKPRKIKNKRGITTVVYVRR